jgi:hypothetical protein
MLTAAAARGGGAVAVSTIIQAAVADCAGNPNC